VCETAIGGRFTIFFVVEGSGGECRQYSLLGEGVPGAGRGRVTESREVVGEPAETSRTGARGIVQNHGGHIFVDSEPGAGTIFKIYLPQMDERTEATREEVLGKSLLRGGETVLVVEDDNDLRSMISQALKRQGYETLEAADGKEGLLLFDKYRQEINLIVTDIVMPVMSGFKLIELLMPVCPQMKVLYMSGYHDNAKLGETILKPEGNFIAKPFSLEELAIKVRKVLDNGFKDP